MWIEFGLWTSAAAINEPVTDLCRAGARCLQQSSLDLSRHACDPQYSHMKESPSVLERNTDLRCSTESVLFSTRFLYAHAGKIVHVNQVRCYVPRLRWRRDGVSRDLRPVSIALDGEHRFPYGLQRWQGRNLVVYRLVRMQLGRIVIPAVPVRG